MFQTLPNFKRCPKQSKQPSSIFRLGWVSQRLLVFPHYLFLITSLVTEDNIMTRYKTTFPNLLCNELWELTSFLSMGYNGKCSMEFQLIQLAWTSLLFYSFLISKTWWLGSHQPSWTMRLFCDWKLCLRIVKLKVKRTLV